MSSPSHSPPSPSPKPPLVVQVQVHGLSTFEFIGVLIPITVKHYFVGTFCFLIFVILLKEYLRHVLLSWPCQKLIIYRVIGNSGPKVIAYCSQNMKIMDFITPLHCTYLEYVTFVHNETQ